MKHITFCIHNYHKYALTLYVQVQLRVACDKTLDVKINKIQHNLDMYTTCFGPTSRWPVFVMCKQWHVQACMRVQTCNVHTRRYVYSNTPSYTLLHTRHVQTHVQPCVTNNKQELRVDIRRNVDNSKVLFTPKSFANFDQ